MDIFFITFFSLFVISHLIFVFFIQETKNQFVKYSENLISSPDKVFFYSSHRSFNNLAPLNSLFLLEVSFYGEKCPLKLTR